MPTELQLYTEGFTTTPESATLTAPSEIAPVEMLAIVQDYATDLAEVGPFPAMVRLVASFPGEGQHTEESFYDYELAFIPEEEDFTFSVYTDSGEEHHFPLDEWSVETAQSVA